jgi:dihydrofolate synthase / folylpolyglutamate synthase
VAVMEAGMGGRSDATAALPGIMTLITPISLDHCDYLGATLAAIASEKSGIAEPGTPIVAANQPLEVQAVVQQYAASGHNRILFAGQDFSSVWSSDGTLDYRGINAKLSGITPGIPGRYQAGNAALALAAAEVLGTAGIYVPEKAMADGIRSSHWPGRMELIAGQPPILLDGAHNEAGAAALAAAMEDYQYRRLLLVAGVMADKDVRAIFAPLAGMVHRAYAVSPAVERALDDEALAVTLKHLGVEAVACGSVGNGIATAQREAGENDLILVCGSLFAVGEAKAWLSNTHFIGIRG